MHKYNYKVSRKRNFLLSKNISELEDERDKRSLRAFKRMNELEQRGIVMVAMELMSKQKISLLDSLTLVYEVGKLLVSFPEPCQCAGCKRARQVIREEKLRCQMQ